MATPPNKPADTKPAAQPTPSRIEDKPADARNAAKSAAQREARMDETHRMMQAIIGPYRGSRLTMTAADADAAMNDHWAIDPFVELPYDHGALDDEEREHAVTAAKAWADAQLAAAQPPQPEPQPTDGAPGQRRDLQADAKRDGYQTRDLPKT